MGGAVSAGRDNDELVDNLKAAEYIQSAVVERVFRAVDRGDYLLADNMEMAYRDNAWKKGNLHLSAPCIYAKVMEGLQLEEGQSFLNLGSGTGYMSTMVGLIIGPSGVNHGVELHADVVAYANDRLSDFKLKATALDSFKFCEPQFVEGNCLCLPHNAEHSLRRYDRVYCGASCPDTHENYMRAFLKVGGVLVMPINDQLVRVTRTATDNWETVTLMPVSFSSLVVPEAGGPAEVALPVYTISDLQDLCRQEIRTVLRCLVEQEHPSLLHVTPFRAQSNRSPRPLADRPRHFFVPYGTPFFESDDDEDAPVQSDEEESSDHENFNAAHNGGSRLSSVLQLARSLTNRRRGREEGAEEAGGRARRRRGRGLFMSFGLGRRLGSVGEAAGGVGEVMQEEQNGDRVVMLDSKQTEENLNVNLLCQSTSDLPTGGEDATPLDENQVGEQIETDDVGEAVTPLNEVGAKREKIDSGLGEEDEPSPPPVYSKEETPPECDLPLSPASPDSDESSMDVDSDFSDYSDHRPSRAAKVTRLDESEEDLDQPLSTKEGDGALTPPLEQTSPHAAPHESYTPYMAEKIARLPLPTSLKIYVNYNRPLP